MDTSAGTQDYLLEKAENEVRKQDFFMMKGIDANDLSVTLEHARNMLLELKTSKLDPHRYFALFNTISNKLHSLDMFFKDQSILPMKELYIRVQFAGNVLVRLYLMCSVGSAYIRRKKVYPKPILVDLLEMVKGVQHPVRGLFLRNFLLQQVGRLLPDVENPVTGQGNEYTSDDGKCTYKDSVSFLLENFVEMNRLWVRMQKGDRTKKRKAREEERNKLKQLIGRNFVLLSNLEGVTSKEYKETVLPRILKEVLECKDNISQAYIMDALIQSFPTEFHLQTMTEFFNCAVQLNKKVNVNTVVRNLLARIVEWLQDEDHDDDEGNGTDGATKRTIPDSLDAFGICFDAVARILAKRPDMACQKMLALQVALMQFQAHVYPGNVKYTDQILESVNNVLGLMFGEKRVNNEGDSSSATEKDGSTIELTTKLLMSPMRSLSLRVLELKHFVPLMNRLDFMQRKKVSVKMLKSVCGGTGLLTSTDMVKQLYALTAPLMQNADDMPPDFDFTTPEFVSEQYLVANTVNLMSNKDPQQLFAMYKRARKEFGMGDLSRILYTLPALIFACLRLCQRQVDSLKKLHEQEAAAPSDDQEEEVKKGGEEEEGEDGSALAEASVQASKKKSKKKKSATTSVSPSPDEVLKFVAKTVQVFAGVVAVEDSLALPLTLDLCLTRSADAAGKGKMTFTYACEAMNKYNKCANDKEQVEMLIRIIGAISSCRSMNFEDYLRLCENVAKKSYRLLHREDSANLLLKSAHLFWRENPPDESQNKKAKGDEDDDDDFMGGDDEDDLTSPAQKSGGAKGKESPYRNGKRVYDCLAKALKRASDVSEKEVQIPLYIRALNAYIFFFKAGVPNIVGVVKEKIRPLKMLIKEELDNSKADIEEQWYISAQNYFRNTLEYCTKEAEKDERFKSICE